LSEETIRSLNIHYTASMSEIVASNVHASTNETEQVIEELQNVDKAAKLSALLGKDTLSSPVAEGEVTNGVSDGDKTEVQHNGTSENGNITSSHAANTNSEDASNPDTTEVTGTEESSTKSDEVKPDESETTGEDAVSVNPCTKQQHGDCSRETPCTAPDCVGKPKCVPDCTRKSKCVTSTTSETEVPTSTESSESPVKDDSADQDAVNKKMKELNVESECPKAPSPGKKSCSPF